MMLNLIIPPAFTEGKPSTMKLSPPWLLSYQSGSRERLIPQHRTQSPTLRSIMMMLLVISLLVSSSLSLISNQIPYQPSSECGDHDVYSSVSLSCRQCGPGTRVTNSSGGECECDQGWILTRSGGAVECGQCPPGHQATSDGRQCIRCQSGGCGACPAGQVSVRC